MHILIQFKVDRPQTTIVAKNLSVLQLFISRMPKMCAILQLVSAPLNPDKTVLTGAFTDYEVDVFFVVSR